MALNHNIYIGWYAEFDRSERIINNGSVKNYFCTKEKKHPVKDKACCLCNGKVRVEEKQEYSRYPSSCQILGQTSQEILNYLTNGRVTLEDLKELEGSMAVFAEFSNTEKQVILAPGAKCYSNLSKINGFVEEIDIEQKPNEKWINKIKEVFDTQNVTIKYGIIMEVI